MLTHCDHYAKNGRSDSLGTKSGVKDEDSITDVFWLVENIKGQLSEFEELRESIRRHIGSMVRLIPSLEDQKRNMQIALEEEKEKAAQIEDLIPKLEGQREKLQDDVKKMQEEISRIEDQLGFFSQLETRRT